jgi:phenylalanine-4-hydroxylase
VRSASIVAKLVRMRDTVPTVDASPPAEAGADWTVPQIWPNYTLEEHATWDTLFSRQVTQLRDHVDPAFLRGLQTLEMTEPGIPNFERLSQRLRKCTGWTVVAVAGLVPEAVFFEHMANRRFVAGRFIREPGQLDYLEEPDVFHDVFGHVPLLADPVFADYMQAYGQGGLRALRLGEMQRLANLYWYTVEFGLMRAGADLKLFGAGIVSSHAESHYALFDPRPLRLGFDLKRVLRTRYQIDTYQKNYFVIDSFEQLLRDTLETDFASIYEELRDLPDIPAGVRVQSDVTFAPNPC